MERANRVKAHYISGTHWDREWYRPLQEFRLLLVELIDTLLDVMEQSEEFKYFHLDGQTCVLADYLEIRPENRGRLEKLMRDERILVGPWYTMPDLFCPGDEALVRNLLMGRRVCNEWGVSPMPVAYTCDMFGHPSQMPQIYRGFGLDYCVLGRGTNEHTTPAFFRWRAPDGSEVFTFKLQDKQGYGAFNRSRRILEAEGADHDPTAEERAKETVRGYIEHEIGRSNAPVLCLMDALDHVMPAVDVPRYLRLVREVRSDVVPEHSTLPAFFGEAEAFFADGSAGPGREKAGLPVKAGELREPSQTDNGYLWLIPNCVSARVEMKQANDEAQSLLEQWVEPFLGIAAVEGTGIPLRFLRTAWEQVLLNHAHDSICGCSIDQVHRDMMYRFDQARILGRQLRHKAFAFLTEDCADLARNDDEFTLTVANPVPLTRRETVVFDVDLPPDYPAEFKEGFRSQQLKSFRLFTAGGTEVPYQRLSFVPYMNERSRVAKPCFTGDGPFTRYRVAAGLDLPALGFTSLRVVPSDRPVRVMGSLRTGPVSAENEHLSLAVEPGGTISIRDKSTGNVYSGLLTFEDRSEIGDGWFHGQSVNDEICLSSVGSADVAVVHDGPELVTFRITVTMNLPRRYDWHTQARSDEREDLRIRSDVTLRRGARLVEVETEVLNTIEDHRLRLLLPTGIEEALTWFAHHPYDLIERPVAVDPETHDWQEPEIPEKPFLGLQYVAAGNRGLAFLSAGGLHEGGVADDSLRTMHITLLRSFRRTVGTEGETDGLELGRRSFRFALMPFGAEVPVAGLFAELHMLQAGLITRQTGPRPSGYPPMHGTIESECSFLEIEQGNLVLSAVKPPEEGEGLIVRLWNPTDVEADAVIRLWRSIAGARYVDMAERDVADSKNPPIINEDRITVKAEPRQIMTVWVEL